MAIVAETLMSDRIVESLYGEATRLAQETRSHFDHIDEAERASLSAREQLEVAGEALYATIRTMQVITWLTDRRVQARAERGPGAASSPPFAESAPSGSQTLGRLPTAARRLILAGIELHERVGRLAAGMQMPITFGSAARGLFPRTQRGL